MKFIKDAPIQYNYTLLAMLIMAFLSLPALFFVSLNWLWVTFFFYFVYCCLGLTIGYHRYFCHYSFKTYRVFDYIFAWAGIVSLQGNPLTWCAVHREHHKHADHEGDPHNVREEGFRAFIEPFDYEFNLEDMKEQKIFKDPMQRWLLRYQWHVLFGTLAVFAIIHPLMLIYAWALPVFLTLLIGKMGLVYFGHKPELGGYKNYNNLKDDSVNNAIIGILSWGDGWHNNHHARPGNWYFGKRWWEIDIAGWIVWLIRTDNKKNK